MDTRFMHSSMTSEQVLVSTLKYLREMSRKSEVRGSQIEQRKERFIWSSLDQQE
jgi:hypothetical protein